MTKDQASCFRLTVQSTDLRQVQTQETVSIEAGLTNYRMSPSHHISLF